MPTVLSAPAPSSSSPFCTWPSPTSLEPTITPRPSSELLSHKPWTLRQPGAVSCLERSTLDTKASPITQLNGGPFPGLGLPALASLVKSQMNPFFSIVLITW